MVRTQVQIPDELYNRAKQLAKEREMTLAEVIRRGLELLLQQYPERVNPHWELPNLDVGRILVPLEQLHEMAAEDIESAMVAVDSEP